MLALTRLPSPRLELGQRTFVLRSAADPDAALAQHAAYCHVLAECGCSLRTLPACPPLPDSVFVEDTAVVLDELAVICSLGARARREETASLEPVLGEYRQVRRIALPATIEGGDVLRLGRKLLVGLSSRTNAAGIKALVEIVGPFGYTVVPVPVHGCLHLKTACTALPDGRLLVNSAWIDAAALAGHDLLPVPAGEPWAANVLPIGQRVIMPAAHQQTAEVVCRLGFAVHTVELSEFAKAEGGVTCLSILIPTEPPP